VPSREERLAEKSSARRSSPPDVSRASLIQRRERKRERERESSTEVRGEESPNGRRRAGEGEGGDLSGRRFIARTDRNSPVDVAAFVDDDDNVCGMRLLRGC
jgi:hypothetical protein